VVTSNESGLSRRRALIGTGLMGAGALAAMMPAGAAAADDDGAGTVGAWLIDAVDDKTMAKTRVLYLATQGGGAVVITNTPPATATAGLGAWKRVGENQFASTSDGFTFDSAGNFTGVLRARVFYGLDSPDEISGKAIVEFQPAGQAQFQNVGSDRFTGTRIKVLLA
jgi:hypothetical protein